MMRRLLAIILCISMLFFANIPVFAENPPAGSEKNVVIAADFLLQMPACESCGKAVGHLDFCVYPAETAAAAPMSQPQEQLPAETEAAVKEEESEELFREEEPVEAELQAAVEPPVSTMALGQALTITGGELTSGTYHLTGNHYLTGSLIIKEGNTVVLDLNGFVLRTAAVSDTYAINSSGNLTIVDSNPSLGHSGSLVDGVFVHDGKGPVSIYGGIITGNGVSKGILVAGGTTTVQGGTIAGCYGNYGPAVTISSSGTLIMQKDPSTGTTPKVLYNRAIGRADGEASLGGAIWGEQAYSNAGSYISISNTTLSHNISYRNGGAICGYRMSIVNSVITDNTVTGGNGGGVNLRGNGGSLSVSNTQITGNTASNHGGGICLSNTGSLYISDNSQVNGNNAGVYGGGIYLAGDCVATISDSTIDNNESDLSAAGLFANSGSQCTLTNASVSGNTSVKGNAGGVFLYANSSFIGNHVTISNNKALYANHECGGLYISEDSVLKLTDSSVSGNQTTGNGGGLSVGNNSIAELKGCTISQNSSSAGKGGGFYGGTGIDLTISDTTFSGNTAGVNGGGAFMDENSVLELTDVTVSGNMAGEVGGGIHASADNTVTLTDADFTNNTAGLSGGGLCVSGGSVIAAKGVTFTGNGSGYHGGAIYGGIGVRLTVSGSTANPVNVFSENTAANGGGAIALGSSGAITISDATFYRNRSTDSGGGILMDDNTVTSLTNVAFTENTSTNGNGGGILLDHGTTPHTVVNCTFTGNTAGNYGGGLYLHSSSKYPMAFTPVNVQFINNTADYGGGMFYHQYAAVTMDDKTVFSGNHATRGGALYGMEYGVFTAVDGIVVTQNTAEGYGGGLMFWHYSTVTLSQAEITYNTAGSYAGGLYMGNSLMEDGSNTTGLAMTDSIISHNSAATMGGGLLSCGDAIISDTVLTYNDSVAAGSGRGGAIAIEQQDTGEEGLKAHLELVNVTIDHNRASYYGAGIQVSGLGASATLNSGSISNNRCLIHGATAVHVSSSAKFTLEDGVLENNTANYVGGAIHASYGCELNLNGGTIRNNTVVGRGGGLHADVGCTVNLRNTVISGNKALSGNRPLKNVVLDPETKEIVSADYEHIDGLGGGIAIDSAEFTMNNGTISGNYAEAGGGGVALVMLLMNATHATYNKVVKFEITGGTVANNTTDGDGGGIYLMENRLDESSFADQLEESVLNGKPRFTASGGTIRGNTAKGNGGAAYLDLDTELYVSGTASILDNHAEQSGGAVYISSGVANISGGTIGSNTAGVNGGALYVHGDISVLDGTIRGNTAVDGGAVYVTEGNFNMTGGVIGGGSSVGNTAANDGGAVYVIGGNVTVASGAMTFNTAGNRGGALHAVGGVIIVGVENCTGEDDTLHAGMKGLTHPTVTNNSAAFGGGISVSKTLAEDGVTELSGVVYMYCGSLKDNLAENEGLGYNVYMDGGTFHYYGGIIGQTENPGIVVIGGQLVDHHDYGTDYPVNYYANFHIVTEGVQEMHQAVAALGQYLNLPDGTAFWNREPDYYFVGWTTYVSGNMSADAHYVRSHDDYKSIGTAVNIKEQSDGSVDFYALWAPASSAISYQYQVNNLDGVVGGGVLVTDNAEAYPYSKRSNEETMLHLISPEKDGYVFRGWILYAGEIQNTNWGSDPVVNTDGSYDYSDCLFFPVDDPEVGCDVQYGTYFGDIVLVAVFDEAAATVKYAAVGPSGAVFGTVDPDRETLGMATGQPIGSTAIPASGYKVVAWYLNPSCTTAVPEEWITVNPDGSVLLVPQKSADALWTDGYTFYARFDYAVADLTIEIDGMDTNTNQSYLFTVRGVPSDPGNAPFTMTVAITCGADNYGSVLIRNLPVGVYTVTEQDGWSWRYGLQTLSKEITLDGTQAHRISYTESEFTRVTTKWLNYFAVCVAAVVNK